MNQRLLPFYLFLLSFSLILPACNFLLPLPKGLKQTSTSIENKFLKVSVSPSNPQILSILSKKSGTLSIPAMKMSDPVVSSYTEKVSDKKLGTGIAVMMKHKNGSLTSVALYSGFPFAVVTKQIANTTSETKYIKSEKIAEIVLNIND